MTQMNTETNKIRNIRAPHKWKQPSKQLVPQGKTTVVTVPAGAGGQTISVPHPSDPGKFISVNVPAGAKAGQAMLVPVPDKGEEKKEPKSWSTGAKVVAGTAAVAGVAGGAVGGAILGAHIAEHGVDATVDAAGAGLEDAGEAIGDFAVDAGEFIVDAAEDVGDFVMDLF